MADQVPALTRDNVREEAGEILSALEASRPQGVFEDNWRKLWQLVREAKAAYLPWEPSNDGPWHLSGDPDHGPYEVSQSLTAGTFVVSIWPPDQAGLRADLPGLLNWAGVPAPHAR
jgi:hypothetical protein